MDRSTWVDVLVASGALAFLLVFHFADLRTSRRPVWARTLGVLGVALPGLVLVRVVNLAMAPPMEIGRDGWLRAAYVLAVALILAAYQWPTGLFRGLVAVVGVCVMVSVMSIGREALDAAAAATDRILAEDLSEDLAVVQSASDEAFGTSVAAAERAIRARPAAGSTPSPADTAVAELHRALAPAQVAPALPPDDPPSSVEGADVSASAAAAAAPTTCDSLDLEHVDSAATRAVRRLDPTTEAALSAAAAALRAAAGSCELVRGAEESVATAEGAVEAVPDHLDQARDAGELLAVARLDVATAVAALIPSEAADGAVATARDSEREARVARERGDSTSPSLVDALGAGGQAVLAVLLGGSTLTGWQPEVTAWLLILVLGVAGYRMLDELNAGLDLGPVEFEGDEKASAARAYLLANFPEPGLQPGSTAVTAVTDLMALDPRGTPIKAILDFLKATMVAPRGVLVSARVGMLAGDVASVTIVVKSRATQRTLRTFTERAAPSTESPGGVAEGVAGTESVSSPATTSGDDLVRRAAYRAAAWVLSSSRATPPWMCWSEAAASAYAQFTPEAADDGENCPAAVARLEEVAAAASDVGEVAYQLGSAYDLNGQPELSLAEYARALMLWPDFTNARYRLAACLCALHDEPARLSGCLAPDSAVSTALSAVLHWPRPPSSATADEWSQALCATRSAAEALATAVQADAAARPQALHDPPQPEPLANLGKLGRDLARTLAAYHGEPAVAEPPPVHVLTALAVAARVDGIGEDLRQCVPAPTPQTARVIRAVEDLVEAVTALHEARPFAALAVEQYQRVHTQRRGLVLSRLSIRERRTTPALLLWQDVCQTASSAKAVAEALVNGRPPREPGATHLARRREGQALTDHRWPRAHRASPSFVSYATSPRALVQYNLACAVIAQARADSSGSGLEPSETDVAVAALHSSLGCADASRVSTRWLLQDPDLQRLPRETRVAILAQHHRRPPAESTP